MILPPLIFASSVVNISLSSALPPSTITPPFLPFQLRATSSSTFSASPSSRHPAPQCRPMKAASSARLDELRVRLCFLVKVRKARGRRAAGGREMGSTACRAGAGPGVAVKDFRGWAGVPKAGEEEGMSEGGCAAFAGVSLAMYLSMVAVISGR